MTGARARDVAIVGGGIAGLTAGLTLARAGVKVTIWNERPGRVHSERPSPDLPGWRIDAGAPSVTYRSEAVFRLSGAVGLGRPGDVGTPWRRMGQQARDRFVADGDQLRPVGVSTLGLRQAAEFARGVLRHRPPGPTETVADWGRLQFGPAISNGLLRAFTVGVWGCGPSHVGFADAWPEVFEALQAGSPLAVQRKMAGSANSIGGTWFLADGMGMLPAATIAAFEEAGGTVVEQRATTLAEVDADHVIVATDATDAACLLEPVDPTAAGLLGAVEHSPIAVVHWLADAQDHPHGFGMLVPPPDVVLGTLFHSDVRDDPARPWAPHGLRAYSTMIGGLAHPEWLLRSDEDLLAEVIARHTAWFGAPPVIRASHVIRWPRAVSIPSLGHRRRIRALREREGRIVFAGSYLAGGTLDDAVASGFLAAERVLEAVL